jgi:hypothetical protein
MEIKYDEWFDKYKPIKNQFNSHAGFEGTMFETFGEELEFLNHVDPDTIWTWTDGGDYSVISNGFHFVNRMGYFITEESYDPDEDIEIDIYEPDECEKSGHEFETVERYDGKEYECCKHCGEDKEFLDEFDD